MHSLRFTLFISLLFTINGYAFKQYDSRGFPYQQPQYAVPFNSPTFSPNPAPFQNYQPTRPRPIYNQIPNFNKPVQKPTYNYNNKYNNHGRYNRNYVVPYVIYYSNSFYPYYPVIQGYSSYDSSYYDDSPAMPIDDINNSVANIPTALPSGHWRQARDGDLPAGALVYETTNNMDTYYCRAVYRATTYYGMLIKGDGCYIQDGSATLRFTQYDTLISD